MEISRSTRTSFQRAPIKEYSRFPHSTWHCSRQLNVAYTRNVHASSGRETDRNSLENRSTAGSAVIQTVEHNSPLRDGAVTAVVGLCMGAFDILTYFKTTTLMADLLQVFVGGVAYVSWYKKNVLDKVCSFSLVSSHSKYSAVDSWL